MILETIVLKFTADQSMKIEEKGLNKSFFFILLQKLAATRGNFFCSTICKGGV